MKTFLLTVFLMVTPAMILHGEIPDPVTDLGGTDDIEKLVTGYPKETYDLTSTFCGLNPTPEFKAGYMMAKRLCMLGAVPHYLVYDELEPLPDSDLPLKTYHLTNYKHTARLLEAIRGFNDAMALRAWEIDARKQIQQGEQAGTGQPAIRSESKSDSKQNPNPETEGRSR